MYADAWLFSCVATITYSILYGWPFYLHISTSNSTPCQQSKNKKQVSTICIVSLYKYNTWLLLKTSFVRINRWFTHEITAAHINFQNDKAQINCKPLRKMTSTQRFQSQREQLIAGLRLAAWTHFGPWALHCAGTYTRHSFGFAHSFRQKTIKLGTCHRITSGIIDTSCWLILNTHRQNHIHCVSKTRTPFLFLRLLCVLLTDLKNILRYCSKGNLQQNTHF